MPHDPPELPWWYTLPPPCIDPGESLDPSAEEQTVWYLRQIQNHQKQIICLLIDIAQGKKYK